MQCDEMLEFPKMGQNRYPPSPSSLKQHKSLPTFDTAHEKVRPTKGMPRGGGWCSTELPPPALVNASKLSIGSKEAPSYFIFANFFSV